MEHADHGASPAANRAQVAPTHVYNTPLPEYPDNSQPLQMAEHFPELPRSTSHPHSPTHPSSADSGDIPVPVPFTSGPDQYLPLDAISQPGTCPEDALGPINHVEHPHATPSNSFVQPQGVQSQRNLQGQAINTNMLVKESVRPREKNSGVQNNPNIPRKHSINPIQIFGCPDPHNLSVSATHPLQPNVQGSHVSQGQYVSTHIQGDQQQPSSHQQNLVSNSSDKHKIVLCGNPGSGKSTVLNTIVGQTKFRSGTSLGHGLTQTTTSYQIDDTDYVDTPGLDDAEFRETAAKEISKALNGRAIVRLLFVLTLEAGRVRPSDLATVGLILRAISESNIAISNRYSIIFNKCEKSVMHSIENPETRSSILQSLGNVTHVKFIPMELGALGMENQLLSTGDLQNFVREAPRFEVQDHNISVDARSYEEERAKIRSELGELTHQLKAITGKKYAGDSVHQSSGQHGWPQPTSSGRGKKTAGKGSGTLQNIIGFFKELEPKDK